MDQFLSTIGTVESPNRERVFAEMSRMEEIVRLPFRTRNQYERWLYNHFRDAAEDMCREDSDMFLRIVDLLRLYHEGSESSEEEVEEGEESPATDDPSDHDSGDGNGEGENPKERSRSPRSGDQGKNISPERKHGESSCKPCSTFGYMNRNEGEAESRRIEQELAELKQRMEALLEEMNEKHSEALTNHDVELATQYRGEIERLEDLYRIM